MKVVSASVPTRLKRVDAWVKREAKTEVVKMLRAGVRRRVLFLLMASQIIRPRETIGAAPGDVAVVECSLYLVMPVFVSGKVLRIKECIRAFVTFMRSSLLREVSFLMTPFLKVSKRGV